MIIIIFAILLLFLPGLIAQYLSYSSAFTKTTPKF